MGSQQLAQRQLSAAVLAALRAPKSGRFGRGQRVARRQHESRLVRALYVEYNRDEALSSALEVLFREVAPSARGPERAKDHQDIDGSLHRILRHRLSALAEGRLAEWPLPACGLADLWWSFKWWLRRRRTVPKLLHSGSAFAGLPEHEDGPATSDEDARGLGYFGRFPRSFLEPDAYQIAGRRLAARAKGVRWSDIARFDGSASTDTIRKQVTTHARELGISLPALPRGRPEL